MKSDNKFKNGDYVASKADPGVRLQVRRYADRIYYCTDASKPESKDLVYFERELTLPR